MIDTGPHPFAPVFTPLRALHTADGRYVELDEAAFRRIGIDIGPLLGRLWQDFTPGSDVDVEAELIRRAMQVGKPTRLPEVRRHWAGQTVRLAVTAMPVLSRRGAPLILREAHLLGLPPEPPDVADGPMAALRTIAGLP